MKHFTPAKILLAICLMLVAIMLLASCSTVKKSQSSHKSTSDSTHRLVKDSTHLVTADSGRLQHNDSTHRLEKDSAGRSSSKNTNTTEVSIWLDTSYHGSDYPIKPEDYTDTSTTITVHVTGDNSVTVDIGKRKALKVVATRTSSAEHTDSSRLKTIENTSVKNTDSSFYHDTASSSTHSEENTAVHKTDSSSSRSSFRVRWPMLIIAAAVALIFFLWRRYRKVKPG